MENELNTTASGNINSQDSLPEYDMKSKRGLAVIFNHIYYNFWNYAEPREGSEKDVETLVECLEELNFDVLLPTYDLTYAAIMEVIKEVVEKKNISCLMIVLMTHGIENIVLAYDKSYLVADIFKAMDGKLQGIPKLFFIQACRGNQVDLGFPNTEVVGNDNTSNGGVVEKDSKPASSSISSSSNANTSQATNKSIKLPAMADTLLMFASNEGYSAYRFEEHGSIFIIELCKVFSEYAHSKKDPLEKNLLELLTIVQNRVAKRSIKSGKKDEKIIKQMPLLENKLCKILKFNVRPVVLNQPPTSNKVKNHC